MKKYAFYPIGLKLFDYNPKRDNIFLDDKVKFDFPWKEDPCEEEVDNTNFRFQKACLDRKFFVLHMIHNEGAYGNGSMEPFKTYWISLGVGESLDGQLKHPPKLIFVDIYFHSFNGLSQGCSNNC